MPFSSPHTWFRGGVLTLLVGLLASGCMTPERAVRESDRVGTAIGTRSLQAVTGTTNSLDLVRPSDRLRARLMLGQGLPGRVPTNGTAVVTPQTLPPRLTLAQALAVGARNDNRYQSLKEAVFAAALDLDLEQHAFENTFEGLLGGGIRGEDPDTSEATTHLEGAAGIGFKRTFVNGASIAGRIGLDVVRLLTGDRDSALGLVGDASMTVPLLRGSGRVINREALTQAERDLLYAVHDFVSYRQDYAVEAAAGYYGVLESIQQLSALRDNQKRLTEGYDRAVMMYEAGRLPQIQVDQTRQDLLRNGEQLVRGQQGLDTEYDRLKGILGLPPDAAIEVDMRELEALQQTMAASMAGRGAVAAPPWPEHEAVLLALTNRHDLIVIRARYEDALRGVAVAADGLRPDLGLTVAGQYDTRRDTGVDAEDTVRRSYSAIIDSSLPWERTAERNAYRRALLALDAAGRAIEAAEDTAKASVRAGLRSLEAAASSYTIQREAVEVAERRVRSTDLFLQAGRAEARDLLEAQDALLTARNALVSAIVRYHLAGLELRRDLAVLDVTEEGFWREPDAAQL